MECTSRQYSEDIGVCSLCKDHGDRWMWGSFSFAHRPVIPWFCSPLFPRDEVSLATLSCVSRQLGQWDNPLGLYFLHLKYLESASWPHWTMPGAPFVLFTMEVQPWQNTSSVRLEAPVIMVQSQTTGFTTTFSKCSGTASVPQWFLFLL